MIKGFKGFNKNLVCNPNGKPFQYEIGKEYEIEGKPVKCTNNGFHLCESPLDVWNYYGPADSRFCEVEADGQIDGGRDNSDSKIACSKLKIGMEIGIKLS